MAKVGLSILVGVLVAGPVVAGERSMPVCVQSQAEMNVDANRELRAAEDEMSAVLESLTKKAAGHPDALATLRRAQSAWVAFRDAQIDALWPSKTPQSTYGTVHPMCVAMERAGLTKQRIAELRVMLKVEEGEVCHSAWPE
jgi:uncharacterized protein YecT (DUF1311 family)